MEGGALRMELKVNSYGSAEEMHSHIKHALSLGLPSLTPALCSHDGTFVVVGSGPSLPNFADEIKAELEKGHPVCAIKGAHTFLLEKGIEPTFYLTLDPRPGGVRHIETVCDNTIYLIASRCHPKVFERLKDAKVILWNALCQDEERKIYDERALLIGGCSTSGLRALNVAYYMGFRKFILYGFDSCLADDGATKRYNGDKAGQVMEFRVGKITNGKQDISNQKVFKSTLAMANQAAEFNFLYKFLPGVTIEAKGDGLIAAIIEQRRQMGLPV